MNKIEQALLNADDLAISEEVDCSDVLGYIEKLETECADKERYTVELYNMAKDAERKLEQVSQETAKEIFHDLYHILAINYVDEEIGYQDECIDTACLYEDLKDIAKKYGVEVDE